MHEDIICVYMSGYVMCVCVRVCTCACVWVSVCVWVLMWIYVLMCATTCVQRVQFSCFLYNYIFWLHKDSSYFYSHPRDISSQDRLNFSFNRSSDNKSHNLFILPVRTGLVKIKDINLSCAHFPRVSNQVGIWRFSFLFLWEI